MFECLHLLIAWVQTLARTRHAQSYPQVSVRERPESLVGQLMSWHMFIDRHYMCSRLVSVTGQRAMCV